MTFTEDIRRAVGQLKRLDKALNAALPAAAENGAKVFKTGAKRRVPKRTGDLEKSINDRKGEQRPGYAEHVVFSDKFYAPFVEYGHAGGVVRPDRAQALQLGADEFYAGAQAGSASPRPFFRTTADQDEADIMRAIEDEALRYINRAL